MLVLTFLKRRSLASMLCLFWWFIMPDLCCVHNYDYLTFNLFIMLISPRKPVLTTLPSFLFIWRPCHFPVPLPETMQFITVLSKSYIGCSGKMALLKVGNSRLLVTRPFKKKSFDVTHQWNPYHLQSTVTKQHKSCNIRLIQLVFSPCLCLLEHFQWPYVYHNSNSFGQVCKLLVYCFRRFWEMKFIVK